MSAYSFLVVVVCNMLLFRMVSNFLDVVLRVFKDRHDMSHGFDTDHLQEVGVEVSNLRVRDAMLRERDGKRGRQSYRDAGTLEEVVPPRHHGYI